MQNILFAIAPMMDWTDRHCRYFHRQLTRRAQLFTEMIHAEALLRGPRERLLAFDPVEHPLALQLGGSDPQRLALAARIGEEAGYDEINLNIGCPSDRVQSGAFGACLMKTPVLVGECVAAMKGAVRIAVSVKCRLGVDDQDSGEALDALAQSVWGGGCDRLWVHARKAWLRGLSPAENRDVPPLDYARVGRLKKENPSRFIGLNGGLADPIHALQVLNQHGLDGAMLGRAAYHHPAILLGVDRLFYRDERPPAAMEETIAAMREHAARHIAGGGRLSHVTRHMTGLFGGLPGARRWRQILSMEANRPGAGADLLDTAFAFVRQEGETAAA
jgi:tRNA-dihydrouridine synthase A